MLKLDHGEHIIKVLLGSPSFLVESYENPSSGILKGNRRGGTNQWRLLGRGLPPPLAQGLPSPEAKAELEVSWNSYNFPEFTDFLVCLSKDFIRIRIGNWGPWMS